MKISFIAENDWANVLTEYAYCLNKHSKDIEAKSICCTPHPFNYTLQHDYDLYSCSEEQKLEAKQFLKESDVIIFGEEGIIAPTNYRALEIFKNILGIDLLNSNKKLCIWHPGTLYRDNFQFFNNHPLRYKIYKHFYAMDLYRLSLKQDNDWPLHTYQYYDFNYEEYIKDFKSKLDKKPWTILHIPSTSVKKGTSTINQIISELNLDSKKFQYKTFTNIPHAQVIQEKTNSLFYIDQFNSAGAYGVAAVESLFKANLTFSPSWNSIEALYKITNEYEVPFIPYEYDINSLKDTLKTYLSLSDVELLNLAKAIGQWFEKEYSPNNIVKCFKSLLNG